MNNFLDNYTRLIEEKKSIVCVGLDPAIPNQRNSNVIPARYIEGNDVNEARLNFCLDIIDDVSDFAIAVKLNEQYMFGMTESQHLAISNLIKKNSMLSIYDCKLGDIAESAESKIYWIHRTGYDALTVFTNPGNLYKIVHFAYNFLPSIGIIAVTLMSNPEAHKYFIASKHRKKSLYLEIASDVKKFNADGCVVGSTKHITARSIEKIRETIGKKRVILFPGIGTQKGDAKKVIKFGGNNILINIGRKIIFSEDPALSAKEYSKRFYSLRKELLKLDN